jgi:hypothetical protein
VENFWSLKVWILFLILLSFVICACTHNPTPANPEIYAGVYIQTGYEFYRWKEGLRLMIWHDGTKSSDCVTSTNSGNVTLSCHAISNDDIRIDWHLETDDGINGDFSIDAHSYDLSDGNLFIVTTFGGDTNVWQLEHDLSEILPKAGSVSEFGLTEPAILEHLKAYPVLKDCISSSTTSSDSPISPELESAQQALIKFFSHLHGGEYGRAAVLYGGEYELMRQHNPEIAPDDHADLFRNACTINGAQCLEILQTTLLDKPSAAEFLFAVQFTNEDGSLFTLSPCCGDIDLNGHQQDEFLYTVRLECTRRYLVMEMPVFVP